MRNALYIKSRLDDISASITFQSEQQTLRQKALLEAYLWLYNNGNLRKETEINIMIQNCLDELKCFEMLGDLSPMKIRPIEEKLKAFKDALKDENDL